MLMQTLFRQSSFEATRIFPGQRGIISRKSVKIFLMTVLCESAECFSKNTLEDKILHNSHYLHTNPKKLRNLQHKGRIILIHTKNKSSQNEKNNDHFHTTTI